MILIPPIGKIKIIFSFLLALNFYSCSTNYKFGVLSKENKYYGPWMSYFTNNEAELNFVTLGDYKFYNHKNFKPTKDFNYKWIDIIRKRNYKFITIAETYTTPYYTFAVQYKKNKGKIIEDSTILITERKGIKILTKEVYNGRYDFLFSFIYDTNQKYEFWENKNDGIIEFEDIVKSIKFNKISHANEVVDSISFKLAKENPLAAINLFNKTVLDSVGLEKADFYLQVKTTAWGFLDELDSSNANIKYGYKYINKRMGIEIDETEVDSVRGNKKNLINKNISVQKFYADAQNGRIVVINESHNNWQHRQNASLIIDSLFCLGYEHLAIEALNYNDVKELNERKYPIQSTGYYTAEPYFGNLIRSAAKKGITFIAYEDTTNEREEGQAKNINDFLKINPTKKLIIYCGWDHISQDTSKFESSMARLLEVKYKIPIVTLNQTEFMDEFIPNINNSNEPFLIVKRHEFKNNLKLYNDYYLLNLKRKEIQSSLKLGDLSDVIIPKEKFPLIIKVYNNLEFTMHGKQAVPIFTKYLNAPDDYINFDFDKEKYKVIFENNDGMIVDNSEITK
jgi:hypothetical protein